MSALDVRAIDRSAAKKADFPAAAQQFRVVIDEAAFDHTVERGGAQTDREVGGVLVGEVCCDAHGPWVHVKGTIDALHADEKGAELTFTHDTWDHIHKEMDARFAGSGDTIVGWWHTHPGFGVFLSDRDQFICQSFFNLPFQIALVYDPKSREHGVFAWRDARPERLRRYWIGERENLWDGDRPKETSALRDPWADAPALTPSASTAALRTGRAPGGEEGEPPLTMSTVGIGALILVLAAGFAGYMLGSRGASPDAPPKDALAAQVEKALGELDTELLGVVRSVIEDKQVVEPLARALAELSKAKKGVAALSDGADEAKVKAVTEPLDKALATLAKVAKDQQKARELLAVVEAKARGRRSKAETLAKEVGYQKSALGQLYLEVAKDVAAAGDKDRAKRLLEAAAVVDPGGHARYEKALKAFLPDATLPQIKREAAK